MQSMLFITTMATKMTAATTTPPPAETPHQPILAAKQHSIGPDTNADDVLSPLQRRNRRESDIHSGEMDESTVLKGLIVRRHLLPAGFLRLLAYAL